MTNILAELQMLSLNEGSDIISYRAKLNEIVATFKAREEYMEEVTWFAELVRELNVETFLNADAFMVQPEVGYSVLPEHLREDSLGFCRGTSLVFSGRFVYPVKDTNGDVMGFCGYDKFSDIKYLDSLNYGYKAKTFSLYGEEKLEEALLSTTPVFFTEGIVCTLYLRQEGFQSFALLGSTISPFVAEIIRWFGTRAIIIADADEAGNKLRAQAKRSVPMARCIQSLVAKDLDDSRKVKPDIINEIRNFDNPFYRSKYFC